MSFIKEDELSLPRIIEISGFGSDEEGFLNIASKKDGLPFKVKRVFWTMNTPVEVSRGRHAHFVTEMALFCVSGFIKVKTTTLDGEEQEFALAGGSRTGLFIPKLVWHEMWYQTKETVQVVAASTYYYEEDYIRDFDAFMSLKNDNLYL